MKRNIILAILVLVLAVAIALSVRAEGQTGSPEFASAVESYVAVEFMVAKHVDTDMLAYKLLHNLTVKDMDIDEIYIWLWNETDGEPPEIFLPYYEDYMP